MSLFGKTILVPETELRIGELDYNVPGCYDNVKTFPLNAKKGKNVFVKIQSSQPIDASIVDASGYMIKFASSVTDTTITAPSTMKGIMSLIVGINPGDRADVKIEAWME